MDAMSREGGYHSRHSWFWHRVTSKILIGYMLLDLKNGEMRVVLEPVISSRIMGIRNQEGVEESMLDAGTVHKFHINAKFSLEDGQQMEP
jgi:hypothetical protein